MNNRPAYNIELSYDQNYTNGPEFDRELPDLESVNKNLSASYLFGKRLNSPLGVPAGPLLNSAYIKLYAELGFDVLTYKTVRTRKVPCHPFPNVLAVEASPEILMSSNSGRPVLKTGSFENFLPEQLSITNSFGMPSMNPETWQEDVVKSKSYLKEGQLLVVSVVGTAREGGSLQDLADDFAEAGKMAVEVGAEVLEANYSCPNVQSGEGSIYQDPKAVRQITATLRNKIGDVPLLIKMGYIADNELVKEVVQAAYEAGVSGIAAINTISANVYDDQGQQALPGKGRLSSGICGAAIKSAGLEMTRKLLATKETLNLSHEQLPIIGVGGVMTAQDALEYINLGVQGVQSATGAMWNPYLAVEFKKLYAGVDATVSAMNTR